MSSSAPGPLLRRLAVPFATASVALTMILVASYAARRVPPLTAKGVPLTTIIESLLLAVPFTAAMTFPMAVFIAVAWVFTRLGTEGPAAPAQSRNDLRRLVMPVVGAAAGVAALMVVWNTQLLPRANQRLVEVLANGEASAPARSDRAMTVGELRAAAATARATAAPDRLRRVARFEIEIQKKFSLAAACIALALAGAAIGLRFRRGGVGLLVVSSLAVFGAYYACIVTGETLANQLVITPFVGMWGANALIAAAAALLLLWRGRPAVGERGVLVPLL